MGSVWECIKDNWTEEKPGTRLEPNDKARVEALEWHAKAIQDLLQFRQKT
jgi:hypothetical protein